MIKKFANMDEFKKTEYLFRVASSKCTICNSANKIQSIGSHSFINILFFSLALEIVAVVHKNVACAEEMFFFELSYHFSPAESCAIKFTCMV